MGGGYYDCDVAWEARANHQDVFTYQGHGPDANAATSRREVHELLNPFGKTREVNNQTPIVVALDVTRSRGDDTKLVYDKLPMFIGQIVMKNYVPGPALSICAIGDATDGDAAPLQVSQFEADNRIDQNLERVWIEEGGGGSGQESYELAAYFYNRTNLVQFKETGRKAYFFFVGDEGFYPQVSRQQVKDIIGEDIPEDIDSIEIFRQLQERFHVFLIYPKKSWKERLGDIDAEIRKRVKEAGGQYDGVDIRASLLWNDRNDLDLHVVTPSGERIFYGHKQSRCGGWLDVDMNVRGETTKPVENVRWKQGEAPKGRYQVIVQNFRFHENKRTPTEFRVELEVNGEIQHFEGKISTKGETGPQSDIVAFDFVFDPAKAAKAAIKDDGRYDGYQDEVIMKQWASAIPSQQILLIEDSRAILDVMMGALAITEGSADLDQVISDLREVGQSTNRQEQVAHALEPLALHKRQHNVSIQGSPTPTTTKARKKRTKRLADG